MRAESRHRNTKRLGRVALVCWLGLSLLPALAQVAPGHSEVSAQAEATLRFRHLTSGDGLAQPDVHAIAQDDLGFLWFGTEDGLYRYDGHTLRAFRPTPFDTTSIAGAWVVGIAPGGEGDLWVATEDTGLNRYEARTETFRRRTGDPVVSSERAIHLWRLLRARDGMLWLGTRQDGLARLDLGAGTIAYYRHDPADRESLSDDHVTALAEDEGGMIWIGTADGGLNRLNPATGQFEQYRHDPAAPASLPDDLVRTLLPGRDGSMWVGTARGLAQWEGTSGRFRQMGGALGRASITALLEDPTGMLWVGTELGLDRFDPASGAVEHYRHDPTVPTSLGAGAVHSLYLDRSQVLWVGTESGLSHFSWGSARFPLVAHRPGSPGSLSDPGVWSSFKEADGTVWVGTEAGLDRFDADSGAVTHYRHEPGNPASLTAGWVLSVFEDSEGTFWVGTRRTADSPGGLNRFDRATGRVVERFIHDPADSTSLQSTNPWNLFEDSQHRLWVLSGSGCPNLMDRAEGTFQEVCPDLVDPAASGSVATKHMTETPDGVVWFATWGAGLARFDTRTDTWQVYRHDPSNPDTPADDTIMALHLAADGTLWLGTYGAGLSRFDPVTETFTHFNTSNSDLPNDVVYAIEEDEAGQIWVSTNQGLTRIEPATERFRTFGLEHGLQDLEFNVASYRAPDGELFFGGIRGLNRFYPDRIEEEVTPPEVVLTGLRIRGVPVGLGMDAPLSEALPFTRTLRLGADQRDLALTFAALDFTNPERNRYRYRLIGYDEAWTTAGPERTATYTNLDPGHYAFEVQAATSAGVWSEAAIASLALVISPPWWRTWWALLAYALLTLGGLGAVYRYRQRRLRLQHRLEIERLEAEQLRSLDRAKSRFFANVSHEFRTPLTLTLGPLDDMRAEIYGPLSAPLAEQVDLARRNAARVLDLVNQILDIARLEAGRMPLRARRLDLGLFADTMVQPFQPLAGRRALVFKVETPPEPVEVWADAGQLEKVVANLLSNALKFTPEGGTVRVTVEVEDDAARLAVRDSGPGIPAADLPHVFDRFHRVNETSARMQPGTGIGLALAREIADLHSGSLTVESEEGFGSTFTLTLPLGRDHLAAEQIADETAPWRPTGVPVSLLHEPGGDGLAETGGTPTDAEEADEDRTTVLVVEDHAEVRAYVRRHLEPDYRVIEAADGEAGLAAARERLPDLVVSDVMMPGLNGFELCRALKADPETSFLPVILLTAKAEREDRLEGLGEHADDYLTKPFDPAELRVRIENLIALRQRLRERFRQEGIALVLGEDEAATPASAPLDVTSADEIFLTEVRAAIEAYLGDETLNVERLAEAVGVSRGHLYRQLKTLADQTPSEAIRTMRLERAAQLLKAEAGTVSEIAYAVGFKGVAHFSNSFDRQFGCRPSAYAAAQG